MNEKLREIAQIVKVLLEDGTLGDEFRNNPDGPDDIQCPVCFSTASIIKGCHPVRIEHKPDCQRERLASLVYSLDLDQQHNPEEPPSVDPKEFHENETWIY